MPETILSESHPDRQSGVVRGWLLWLVAWALAFAVPVDGHTSESTDDWRTRVELAGYDVMGCAYYRVREESGKLSRLHFYLGVGDYYVMTYRNSRCNLGRPENRRARR